MNRLILFFVFLYLPYSAFSQGIWKTYTRVDGLAGDTVRCITQDKLGNYWIGSWAAGLTKLDTNGVWTTYLTDSISYVTDIEIDKQNNKWLIVFRSGGGYVVKFDDSTFIYYSPTWSPYDYPIPSCLGQDSLGNIWCGTSHVLAYWFDGLNWNLYSILGLYGTYSCVNEIQTDHQGKLFFSHDDGISTLESCIFGRRAGEIAFDLQNRMWFTTFLSNWGLGMFDGMTWHSYTWEDGLLRNDISQIAIDSSYNIWFSYSGGFGISKFDGYNFSHYDYHDGLAHNTVYDIYVDDKGDIWFATKRGVSALHDTTTTRVAHNNKFVNDKNSMNLFYNYPNPFNNVTQIKYALNTAQNVELTIYNLLGEEVITLINKWHQPGEYMVQWDGKNRDSKEVNSDLYIALLKSGVFKKTIKLSLIR